MFKATIDNFEDLDQWLADNFDFEDGHVLSVTENPLEIVVGYNVVGNYKANSEKHIKRFKLTPHEIHEWTFDNELLSSGDGNYIIGIEGLRTNYGIGLEVSSPAIFRLITNKITIEELELIKTTFEPFISEDEISIEANLSEIPEPSFWKEKLSHYGHTISFRFYTGDEKQPEEVPYPDYSGYFIQLPHRIGTTLYGIFISHLYFENGKIRISFENKDEDLNDVWIDLTRILADLPDAKIYSGNCEFTGPEWEKYLTDKILPTN